MEINALELLIVMIIGIFSLLLGFYSGYKTGWNYRIEYEETNN